MTVPPKSYLYFEKIKLIRMSIFFSWPSHFADVDCWNVSKNDRHSYVIPDPADCYHHLVEYEIGCDIYVLFFSY